MAYSSPDIRVTHGALSMNESGGSSHMLVLKLDHLGDFIIALPAFERLRREFPDARITLVCGAWNVGFATETGLFDAVLPYSMFPRNARDWDGEPAEGLDHFKRLTAGRYDIAIDMRVDDDTRFLLQHVDATIKCGIGPAGRFPFLNVVLPPMPENRVHPGPPPRQTLLAAPDFATPLPCVARTIESDFSRTDTVLLTSPPVAMAIGQSAATFRVGLRGWGFSLLGAAMTFEILRDGMMVADRTYAGKEMNLLAHGEVRLEFRNLVQNASFTFRVLSRGRPIRGRFTFHGLTIENYETIGPRYRAGVLHIGEQLSLLTTLVAERCRDLYAGSLLRSHYGKRLESPLDAPWLIALAPISNSSLRDWPAAHYAGLARLLLARMNCRIVLVGSRDQHPALEAIRAVLGGHGSVENVAGLWDWSDLPARLGGVDLIICNNSGIAHMGAACGVRTLAIYSASHPVTEWGPRGPNVEVMVAEAPCAPCGHDVLHACTQEHMCMVAITPEAVFRRAQRMLDAAERVATEWREHAMPRVDGFSGALADRSA